MTDKLDEFLRRLRADCAGDDEVEVVCDDCRGTGVIESEWCGACGGAVSWLPGPAEMPRKTAQAMLDVVELADYVADWLDTALGYVRDAGHHRTASGGGAALRSIRIALRNLTEAGGE